MMFHEWFNSLPRTQFCAKCGTCATVWHKHWGKADEVAKPTVTREARDE